MDLVKFTLPKRGISPFYRNVKKIPRKLKKKVKKVCGMHWTDSTNEERLWYYLGVVNPKYKQFLINQVTNEKIQ